VCVATTTKPLAHDTIPPLIHTAPLQPLQRAISQPLIIRADIQKMRVKQLQLFPQLDILLLFPLFKILIAFCLGVKLGEALATGTAHVRVVLVVDF